MKIKFEVQEYGSAYQPVQLVFTLTNGKRIVVNWNQEQLKVVDGDEFTDTVVWELTNTSIDFDPEAFIDASIDITYAFIASDDERKNDVDLQWLRIGNDNDEDCIEFYDVCRTFTYKPFRK